MKRSLAFCVPLFCLFSSAALAQFSEPVSKVTGKGTRYREVVVTVPSPAERCVFFSCSQVSINLRGLLWLPEGRSAPYKAVVFSHGAQGPVFFRPTNQEPDRYGIPGELFQKGYAVLIALRKGRTMNDLPDPEVSADDHETNSCSQDMRPGLKSAATDLKAYLRVLAQRPDIDANSILLAGQSRGGATSLTVAAEGFPGVVGVMNFSGGWITPYAVWGDPGARCQPAFNLDMFKELGEKIQVPVLSLYGDKDERFDISYVQKYLALLGKRPTSDYLIVQNAGHSVVLGSARPAWEEKQARFLKLIGH